MNKRQKKIGIITLYHKSVNYGGNLQAYALCKFLTKKGYLAEQICFSPTPKNKESIKVKVKRFFFWGIGYAINNVFKRIKTKLVKSRKSSDRCLQEKILKRRKDREKAFLNFNENLIPHSEEVYFSDTISKAEKNYDIFITGSDQVWNFKWYNSAYFLDFVSSSKIKISYAASIAIDKLNRKQTKVIKESLEDYSIVSVREQRAVEQLTGKIDKPVELVLDPTFLLSKEDWDTVCKIPENIEPYVLCYFLGDNPIEREIATDFARRKSLRLVSILRPIDSEMVGISLYDASPEEFIGLIKKAEYIFTDSFHAVVFSYLYQKQYFVFNRSKDGNMNSRIVNITKLLCTEERFCNGTDENIDYVNSLKNIDYTRENKEFMQYLEKSQQLLLKGIEGNFNAKS